MKSAFRFVMALLREIFDENAYRRHLEHHGLTHSPDEWRRFYDALWEAKSRRGRCC
jgi:hypothetical protein